MIIYEPMLPKDVLSLDLANLDAKSENFTFSYYMGYLLNHPCDFFTVRSFFPFLSQHTSMIFTNPILGYAFGRKELKEKLCYHLSAISVAPSARELGIGTKLMRLFECTGNSYEAWFIDLFVRESNKLAISFYKRLGYVVYRTIFDYYMYPRENAFDMRLSLDKDSNKELLKSGEDVNVENLKEYY
ncbi:uncharacterized protein VICG_01438 [Vittaforma corneae ATCC 50505]|uniref:N-acetyltransferase domain-containing protein n=1 Tax=Vittaforma corneae (strain ATCC 50505) TaxID=993615 RepID=L2GLR6_VITCO|nr:uncharacterized protein VICG_01438 [Vittaforma corneae ATCC 50505]ELA41574.1 hypothetical protein VICG_01438 [Vittaforma corneae ATCC 50505]